MATVTGTDNSETIDQDTGVTQGQDIINALGGNDFVFGLGGSDEIHGGSGNDDIFGDIGFAGLPGPGNDLLFGDAGNDTLRGEAGDDVLEGGADGDFLVGGDGEDTASYANSPEGVSVNLSNGVVAGGDAAGDTFSNIENLKGSGHADTLIGDGGNNLLVDSGGTDTLIGGFGDDIYVSIDGNDTIIEAENAGHDSLVFSSGFLARRSLSSTMSRTCFSTIAETIWPSTDLATS